MEENTMGTPGNNVSVTDGNPEPGQGSTSPDTGTNTEPQGSIFTPEQQEKVNQIVSKRVNEVKAEYSEAERKAKILDSMLQDPKFQQWLESQAGGADSSLTGGNGSTGNSVLQELQSAETIEDLVKTLPRAIQEMVKESIRPVLDEVKTTKATTHLTGIQVELQKMANTLDASGKPMYPYLYDPTFQQEVMSIIQNGRAFQLPDAYHLAVLDRQKTGKAVPESAFLLQSHFGTGMTGREEKGPDFSDAPKNATPEQILEYVTNKLGYK